jgi:putative flippase GtrA/glycosyltransferase involved in cell wall biosynthesis
MKILIATGIYPPKIGGPAEYAKNLREEFEKLGHVVNVKTYDVEDKLPTGMRHLFFFLKIIKDVISSDAIFILDTFSVGWPTTLACKIFGKKGIIRTGGDFLWEQYVERTGKKILLRNFYDNEKPKFSFKEKIVFKLTRWTLNNATKIIFSTEWQRDIFIKAYGFKRENTCIVENYFGPKNTGDKFESKMFVGSTRNLVWKNIDTLKSVFEKINSVHHEVSLFLDNMPYKDFIKKINSCYGVILVSLGDISPNMITDAIKLNKPFICTKEVGIYDRIKNAGIFVDPLNKKEIEEAISIMLTEDGYAKAQEKVENFNFVHTWSQIAGEFIDIYKSCGIAEPKASNFIKNVFHSFIAVRYFLCGITSAALNILALYIFTDIVGIWYLYSSVMAFFVSLVVSFTLQKFVVFKDMKTGGMHYQFSKFSIALLLGVTTNTVVMFVCVDVFGIWYILAQVVAGFFVMIQNFTLYKFFIFNNK